MSQDFHVGWCQFCNQGWIDIVKHPELKRLVLLCNECDTIWETPDDLRRGLPNNSFLDETGCALVAPTLEEVKKIGWDRFLMTLDDLKND